MIKRIRKIGIFVVLGIFLLVSLTIVVAAVAWDSAGNQASSGDVLGTTNTQDLVIVAGTGGPQRMIIDANTGYVGIGLAPGIAPASLLEVDKSNPPLTSGWISEVSRTGVTNAPSSSPNPTDLAIAFGIFDDQTLSGAQADPVIQGFDKTSGGNPSENGVNLYINPNPQWTPQPDRTCNTILNLCAGNVGIGTSTPNTKLDVTGTIKGTGLVINGGVSGSGFNGWDKDASNDITKTMEFGGDVTGTYDDLQLAVGIIESGDIADDAITSAKIGTGEVGDDELENILGSISNPYGDDSHVAQISVDNNGRVTAINEVAIDFAGSETDPQVDDSQTTNYVPKWDGSKLVTGTIFDNNNIGIGISNKLSKLTVAGSSSFTLTGTVTKTIGSSTLTGTNTKFLSEVGIGDRISVPGGGGTETKTVTAITSNILLTVDSDWLYNANGQTVTDYPSLFRVEDSSNAVNMVISDQGKVGFGTTSPSESLDIVGNIKIGGSLGEGIKFSGYDNENLIVTAWDSTNQVDVVKFYTPGSQNPNEIMRINSAGLVGIGTDDPRNMLHIKHGDSGAVPTGLMNVIIETNHDTALAFLSNTDNTQQISFGDAGNNAIGYISYLHSSDGLRFGTNGNCRISIQSDGTVGINDIYPNAMLDIASTADKDLFRVDDNGDDDSSPFIIDSDGNVGIGITGPNEKLEVNGGIKIGAALNSNAGTIQWDSTNSDFEGYDGTSWVSLTSGHWSRDSTNNEVYPANIGDEVGIGTSDPREKLEVDGRIRANTGFNYNGLNGYTGTLTIEDGEEDVCHWLHFHGGILTSYSVS